MRYAACAGLREVGMVAGLVLPLVVTKGTPYHNPPGLVMAGFARTSSPARQDHMVLTQCCWSLWALPLPQTSSKLALPGAALDRDLRAAAEREKSRGA